MAWSIPRNTSARLLLLAALLPVAGSLCAADIDQATDGACAPRALKPSAGGAMRPRACSGLARADSDGNGALSRCEAQRAAPRLAAHFDRIDANQDGQLSPQEIRAWSRSHAGTRGRDNAAALEQHFARADLDGNGTLSHEEAERGLPRLAGKFARVDTDGDGSITREEWRSYLLSRQRARTSRP